MFALDTNTISYYFRGDPQVVPRMHALPPARVGVPSVVVYELRYGLMRLAPAAAQSRLEALDRTNAICCVCGVEVRERRRGAVRRRMSLLDVQ